MTKISDIVVVLPCAGRRSLNVPRGHVYMLYRDDGSAEAIANENLNQRFGESGYKKSSSDTICEECYHDILAHNKTETIKKPYSGELLHQLIAEKVGVVRVMVGISQRSRNTQDFDFFRTAEAEFNAGLCTLIGRIAQQQIVVSDNVGRTQLEDMLATSRRLDWQKLDESTWQTIYHKYQKYTGKSLLS